MNRKYPDEMESYIRSIAAGKSSQEIAEMVNTHFGIQISWKQCRCFMDNHKITSGYDCRFKPGQKPANKGKKLEEYMTPEGIKNSSKTRFKKGNIPHNHAEVGTEVVNSDGYWKRKIAEPNKWELLHRIVWSENFGEIPEGKIVSFRDGNPLNCVPENLFLQTRAECAILNRHVGRSSIPEITDCKLQIARIMIAGRKARTK